MALNRLPESAHTEAYVSSGDQQPSVVGADARYGARLPYPDETLTTEQLGAIVCPRSKRPGKSGWQWLKTHRVPVRTSGRQLLISGASVLAALKDAETRRRRRNAERQQRRVS